jgi:diguanylate cyclase (GGDEF)-like protein
VRAWELAGVTFTTDEPTEQASIAVLEATRALLWVQTSADARRATERLVQRLGGTVVPARTHDAGELPADISFGDGGPLVASAPVGSAARALLDAHLVPFLLDARRALQLSGRVERLDEEASTDRLTSLPNRRTLERALGRLEANATVIMVDLDHFKRVNDEFGHHTGDEVLLAFGKALHSVVRGTDFVGRFGGEEFVVIISSPVGADSFLERLQAKWEATRPLLITFSAGIARSVGDPSTTLQLADAALYRAKEAGRNQWVWAQPDDLPSEAIDRPPSQFVDRYVEDAVSGERQAAIRTTLDMFDRGVTQDRVIGELLAAGQREVGERWHRNQLTVADEHIATGVSAAALDALVSEVRPLAGDGHTIVVCAEGDWHSLAAQMFGESLHGFGVGVTVLGASTPASYVAELLTRRKADSLAISCSLPIFFPGAIRLIDMAHLQGIPVIAGGRAFGTDGERAKRLGADAWALNAEQAATILKQWRLRGPPTPSPPASPDPKALHMLEQASEIAQAALPGLVARFPPMADYGDEQLTRTHEDLAFNVQFLAAAMLIGDDTIFTDFLDWLQSLLANRGVPGTALPAGLEALKPAVHGVHPDGVRLLEIGRRMLVEL